MKRGTTIHLRGKDARNFMQMVGVDQTSAHADNERKMYVPPRSMDMNEVFALPGRLEKAEAERDALARKFAEVSDRMNGHNPPLTFCHACGICPANSDSEMEGLTCEVRLREWAATEAQREGVPT